MVHKNSSIGHSTSWNMEHGGGMLESIHAQRNHFKHMQKQIGIVPSTTWNRLFQCGGTIPSTTWNRSNRELFPSNMFKHGILPWRRQWFSSMFRLLCFPHGGALHHTSLAQHHGLLSISRNTPWHIHVYMWK